MTDRQAFKIGFLSRCVEEGLDFPAICKQASQLRESLEKQALWDIPKAISSVASPVLDHTLRYGIPAALVAPAVAGGLGGFGLAKLTDVSDVDPDEVKKREIAEEFRQQTEQLQRQLQMRRYRAKRKKTGRVFL